MRLSDIRGERVFDVLADIVEPICSIASDKDAVALFKGGREDGQDVYEFVAAKIRRAVPVLMRGHRDDIVAIMSSIKGQTRDEYVADLTMGGLIADLYEMLTDEDLLSFLSSSKTTAERSGTSSASTGGQPGPTLS
jgi:hypothetical protein